MIHMYFMYRNQVTMGCFSEEWATCQIELTVKPCYNYLQYKM